MKHPSLLNTLFALVLALAWTCGSVKASTVFWNSDFNDNLFDSAGQPLGSNYSFEMGTFANGFVPTYGNVDQWAANWKVFDRAFDPDSNGWNAGDQFFTSTVEHMATGESGYYAEYTLGASPLFAQGETVYLWVYNSKDIVPGSEWALLSNDSSAGDSADDWIMPDPADTGGSYTWLLSDADASVIGGVDSVQGPGDYTATPGLFSLQTAAVPEPGSAFLLLAAAAAHLVRRARHTTRMTML